MSTAVCAGRRAVGRGERVSSSQAHGGGHCRRAGTQKGGIGRPKCPYARASMYVFAGSADRAWRKMASPVVNTSETARHPLGRWRHGIIMPTAQAMRRMGMMRRRGKGSRREERTGGRLRRRELERPLLSAPPAQR